MRPPARTTSLLATTLVVAWTLACGGGPKGGGAAVAETLCFGMAGTISADLRIVLEGDEVTGGMLSFLDDANAMHGMAAPLAGKREGPVIRVRGRGQVDGEEQETRATLRRGKGGWSLTLNGTKVPGKLEPTSCEGDW